MELVSSDDAYQRSPPPKGLWCQRETCWTFIKDVQISFIQTIPVKACLQLSQMWQQLVRTDEDEGKERAMEIIGFMKTAPWGCNGRVESGRIGKGALEVWVGPRHTLWFGHFTFSCQRLGPGDNLETWISKGASQVEVWLSLWAQCSQESFVLHGNWQSKLKILFCILCRSENGLRSSTELPLGAGAGTTGRLCEYM